MAERQRAPTPDARPGHGGSTDITDIVVLGGGPAGCVAAKRLVELGYSVTMFAGPRPAPALEGLSDRVLESLAAHGFHKASKAVGPAVPRVATWNGETSSHNTEHLVDRSRFDAALLADASEAGANVVADRVTDVRRAADGWRVSRRRKDGSHSVVSASCCIEARGRAAPRGRARCVSAPATIALSRRYIDDLRAPRSAVASCRFGWAWFMALGDGTAALQLIAATGRESVPKRAALRTRFDDLLGGLAEAAEWFRGARPTDIWAARDATLRLTRPLFADRFLRIGDAAVAVDPLSGHGVFEAIGSAMAAAAVVNTLLRRSADTGIARRFYEDRMEDTFTRYARAGRQFYVLEDRWPEEPFWRERSVWPDDRPPHAMANMAGAAIVSRPVIEDGFVVEREVVVTDDHARGIHSVADVAVVPLLRLLDGQRGQTWSASVITAANHFEKPPEQVDTAVRWLSRRGLLSWAEPGPTGRAD